MESIFDKLVREISEEERQRMLDKINKMIGLTNEPMWYEDNPDSDMQVQAETFGQLSLFSKIRIILLEFFTGEKRENLIKNLVTSGIRKRLARRIPHLIDLNKGLLYPEFHGLLVMLQSAVKVFNPILPKIISVQKPDFYVYLFKAEDEYLYNRLEIEPERIIFSNEDVTESEIRKNLNRLLDELTENISRECRIRMMSHAFILSKLNELSVFPYERLISLFEKNENDVVSPASLTETKVLLMELGDALYSFQTPPSPILLEAMFLFSIESSLESGGEDFDMDASLSVFMKRAGDSLSLIRAVNRKIPWLDLLKAISGDARYVPYSPRGGGEEWFQFFKKFWKKRIETKHNRWLQKRKKSEYLSEFKDLWGVGSISLMTGYREEGYQENIQFQHVHSVAVIKTMFLEIFPGKLYHVLSRIVNRGQFYKNRNKKEFDTTFLHFILAQEKIREMEKKFREDGEYRVQLNSIFRRANTKREQSQMIKEWTHDVDRKSRGMVHSCTEDIELMAKLLKGIITGSGEDYDTLSNFKEVSDSSRAEFQKELEKAYKIVSRTFTLLRELLVLEGDSIG